MVKIGDIVRFISEKLEGKVTGIINNNMVNVFCDEYGFEIPASVNDLVVIRSDFASSSAEPSKQQTNTQAQKSVNIESADTVYLAVIPEDFSNLAGTRYELSIINDTAQTCLYSVAFSNGEKYTGITAGNCSPDSDVIIGSYSIKELDNVKAVNVQVIFYHKGNCILRKPIDTQIKISLPALCKAGAYKHTRWYKSMVMLRPLDKETIAPEEIDTKEIQKVIKEKEAETPAQRPARQVVNNILEIDLHINQLLETTSGMDNKDMLEYQLDVFHKTLEEYKLRKGQKIVFIHGKGDGVLRQRILWELQTKYKRFQHQDASFKQYGYGATMVTIK